MEGNCSYEINEVCVDCYDNPAYATNCNCWHGNYKTIKLEFKVCNCCKHTDYSDIPFTEFNRQQLGDERFQEEIKELELQARINSFTYQIDSFTTSNQVNKGESAVRVTCIETGKVVECSEHRSRYQNIEQAKKLLVMTDKERAYEWYTDLSVNDFIKVQKQYGIYGHDQGATEDEILEMYKLYKDEH